MAMQIQRGLVKYKDRSDIICTYGISDTGVQYYFLDEEKLPNGNIIVTTTLLEAVDSVALASHVGMIDENGNEIIPCENKAIKSISSDILLVERAQPIGKSVLESIKLRDDPTAATRLVTTSATIKDHINQAMGENGRFVFNDQFSEATIVDMNGNNLANGEYYSFIGVDDKKIYFSKNTLDSPVNEYSLYPINEETEENAAPTLNVETTNVTADAIDKAINEEFGQNNDNNDNNNNSTGVIEVEPIAPPLENNQEVPVEDEKDESSVNDVSVEESNKVEESSAPDEEQEDKIKIDIDEEENSNIENESDEKENEESSDSEIHDEESDSEDEESDDNNSEDEEYSEKEEYKEEEEDDTIKSNEPVYVEDEFDYDDGGYDNLVQSYDFESNKSSNYPQRNIFDDVTATISNLVELNRNLQAMVDDSDLKLAKCEASRKKLVELSKSQAREISSLNARIARLESEKQILETKLDALQPSSNGDLVRVMADAKNILGENKNRLRRKNNY